ncbi:MAG: hypothetical protein J6575_03505 [Bifidobacterium sp.]|nr:hypothetical protein [Bifidobacterium sp.]
MSALGVTTENGTPEDDQSWLVNRMSDGIQAVQVALGTFTGDPEKEASYFDFLSDTDTVGHIKSGIPLALITGGDNKGMYGPYDPQASDGRNGPIEGVLESQVEVQFTRSGFKTTAENVGMRYMAVINTTNLPVKTEGATWHGLFVDCHQDGTPITLLGAAPAPSPSTESAEPAKKSDETTKKSGN